MTFFLLTKGEASSFYDYPVRGQEKEGEVRRHELGGGKGREGDGGSASARPKEIKF